MTNKIQKQSLLQIWTATHSKTEIARAVNNLTSTERKFFSDALNFQNKSPTLSDKGFHSLISHLKGDLTLPARIRRSVRIFFGGKSNVKTILKSRENFIKNGSETLDRINTLLSDRITTLASIGSTPKNQRKIASLELSKDLVGQALVFSESQSIEKRIQKLETELQNPDLSTAVCNRKNIALSGLKEKLSKDEFASLRRGTSRMLLDVEVDRRVNESLIALAKDPSLKLNPEFIGEALDTNDKFIIEKIKKLLKQATVTNLSNKGAEVSEKHQEYIVRKEDLQTLLVEKQALITKATAYKLFKEMLPAIAPAA